MNTLLQVSFQHAYFPQGQWLDVQVTPTAETRHWLTRLGLLLTQKENQWLLFDISKRERADILQYLLQQMDTPELHFWLAQPLANFVWFTDLPSGWQGRMDFASDDVQSQDNAMLMQAHDVPFGDAPTGSFGKMCFRIEDLLEHQDYKVSLKNRSTTWRYNILQTGQRKLQSPAVVDSQGTRFSDAESFTTEQGELAWWMQSEQVLPLEKEPNIKLKLIDTQVVDQQTGRSVERTILPCLPTPRTDQGNMAVDGGELTSVMYVYV